MYIYYIIYIYVYIYTKCPPGYYYSSSGRMVIHALGHVIYGHTLLAPMNPRVLNKSSKKVLRSSYICRIVCHESLITLFIIKYKKLCFANLNGIELMKT